MIQRNSVLFDLYGSQSKQPSHDLEPISPLRASGDPRFNFSLTRKTAHQQRLSQQQVSPTNRVHSAGTTTVNSNAWSSETSTPKSDTTDLKVKEKCLTPVWKNRLQGLLVGLIAAAIATRTTVAIFLTRPTTHSITPTTTTAWESLFEIGSLRWDPTGVTIAGNGTVGNTSNELHNPYTVYVDSNNAIYVADYFNHRIQQWLPNAVDGTTVAGVTGMCGQDSSGYLCYPIRICGDSQQNLYIADTNGIYLWPLGSSAGTMISGSSTRIIGVIYGIFVDNNRNLYASVNSSYSVLMWTPTATSGVLVAGGNGMGNTSSYLYYSYGLSVDSSTNTIYVPKSNLHTIVAWPVGSSNGTIVVGRNGIAGGGFSLLRSPHDVKCDSNGNLYVADTGNNRVLMFCQNLPSTTAITIVDTDLNVPQSIALDSNLNVYVADFNNQRIQKFNRIV